MKYIYIIILPLILNQISLQGIQHTARNDIKSLKLNQLKKSINNLINQFPNYKKLGMAQNAKILTYQKEIEQAKQNIATGEKNAQKRLKSLIREIKKFRHKVIISNPLIANKTILFVMRNQYEKDHHNTATVFKTDEINTKKFNPSNAFLKSINLTTNKITTIVDPGKTGLVRDPELNWDGTKIVFAMRKSVADNYHIYQVNIDGTQLKQLTSAKGVFDIDPVYLPNGDIVFSSSREPKYCMCNRHIMGNLFRMEADGANIHQIGKSTLFEGHSSILKDGRILYYRWEYVDRNFGDAQGLWTVNPDGTNHAIFWGNNTTSPGAVIDGREIPNTNLVIAIFSSCHDLPRGAVAIIDRQKGVDGKQAVVKTWPKYAINLVDDKGEGRWDAFKKVRPKYEDPFPISKNYFLVSRQTGRGEQTGIYLIDMFGNEDLLHLETNGCYDPMIITKRKRPRIIPTKRDYKQNNGYFYVQNCYIGTHMKGVKSGDIKYLRIVEAPEKRSWTNQMWTGQGTIAPSMNWHDFSNKRILGTVPVEVDGSAYFEVPPETFVFFQVLDKNGKMIHSMRSGTIIQSGEVQGCIGCHEDRIKETPNLNKKNIMALTRMPSKLHGWYGKPRLFNYLQEIQPIFDKHCMSCHDFGKQGAKKLILAGDKNNFFNASYMELWQKKYITCIGGGPAKIQKARSWGACKSKLISILEHGHKNTKLSQKEMNALITWIDINAPYYPSYDSAYPNNITGRSPLTFMQLKELSRLTGAKFIKTCTKNRGPLVSFDRPQISPCLQKLKINSPKYLKALKIITDGKKQLEQNPRADMKNFIPAEYAKNRQKFYKMRKEQELKIRKAICNGKKIYDPGILK